MNRKRRLGIGFEAQKAYLGRIVKGALAYVRSHTDVWSLNSLISVDYPTAEWLARSVCDAVVLFGPDPGMVSQLKRRGIVAVNVSNRRRYCRVPSVVCDDIAAGRMGAEHFLDLGLPHFAFMSPHELRYVAQRRQVSGASCLIAVADRLTGTQGDNTWQMALPRELEVAIDGNNFTVTAKSGETLKGTVVLPAKAETTTVDYDHVHEINYHGGHDQRKFLRRALLVKGTDKDQDFLVVMTIQRGAAPKCKTRKGAATIGKQKVSFDGSRIELKKFKPVRERAR